MDDEESTDSLSRGSGSSTSNNLFVFRRKVDSKKDEYRETTLQTTKGESMKDVVKRLQTGTTAKQLLTFTKTEAKGIAAGTKQVFFCLTQIKSARFHKDVFASMSSSEVLALTTERPIVVELVVEDIRTKRGGQQVDIF